MATYYVDATSGNDANDGSQDNPWKTLQKALDTAVAGDTVYGRNVETLSAVVDDDTNSGSYASWITFIGNDASWTSGHTQWTIDGNSGVQDCVRSNSVTRKKFIGIIFKRATRACFYSMTSTSSNIDWYKCKFQNSAVGIYGNTQYNLCRVINCYFSALSTSALYMSNFNQNIIKNCVFDSCDAGISTIYQNNTILRCAFLNCTTGAIANANNVVYENCIFYGCGTALSVGVYNQVAIGCVFVNNTTALSIGNNGVLSGSHNLWYGNTTKHSLNANAIYNTFGGDVDASENPLINPASGNVMPKATADLINTSIDLIDGINTDYVHAGLGIGPWLYPVESQVIYTLSNWGPNGTGYGPGELSASAKFPIFSSVIINGGA